MELKMPDSFLTGHAVIDAEHRALFDSADRALSTATNGVIDEALEAIDDFSKRFQRHMVTEEQILVTLDYPHRDVHIQHHQRLLRDVEAIGEIFRAEGNVRALYELLTATLIDDMVETDMHYVSFLMEKGAVKPN